MPSGKKGPRIAQRSTGRTGGSSLNAITDTASTTAGATFSRRNKDEKFEGYESVEPIPKELKAPPSITWEDVKRYGKIAAYVFSAVATVAAAVWAASWKASELNSNVSTLQIDVKEVRAKANKLVEESITHSVRLTNVEKGLSELQSDTRTRDKRSPPTKK